VTVGQLKGLITDKPAPITEPVTNKTKKNKDVSNAGAPHISTSNSSTGADGVVITYAQTKVNATKKDSDLDLGKRIDHTLGGVDVPKLALKDLVSDATSPLTNHNVKTEEQKAEDSKGNTLPLTHYQDVKDFANGAKAHETKKEVTAWELPAYLATKVQHKPSSPVKLVQKSDADGLFKLMDANVTRGNLKNLVTDKPSPITVGLAQKSDADGLFKLMDANVTRGNLKNLVTDKPSPITVGLA